jgi:hypothetical protein
LDSDSAKSACRDSIIPDPQHYKKHYIETKTVVYTAYLSSHGDCCGFAPKGSTLVAEKQFGHRANIIFYWFPDIILQVQ